jgi:uncharacterized SAM-binding protein YcdF (DUF218 family)
VSSLVSTLKDNLQLLSPLTLLIALGVGVALLYNRRAAPWGRRWLLAMLVGYFALSTPVGSWLFAAPLTHGQRALRAPADARGAQAVVVLSGDFVSRGTGDLVIDDLRSTALRVIEGVRVYRLLGDPLLVVSGGDLRRFDPPRPAAAAMRNAAVGLGVPPERIATEVQSLTTREQALFLSRLLADRHISRLVLVTSAVHMPRSLAVFRASGLDPVPSASDLAEDLDLSLSTLVPNRDSLNLSDAALYEYAALAYYRARRWL